MQTKGAPSPVIVTALPIETKAIQKALRSLSGEIRVLQGAIGSDHAYQALKKVAPESISVIVSAGLAGALVPELKVGDVICSPEVPRYFHHLDHCTIGLITCNSLPIHHIDERKSLVEKTGAIAVDMESDGIARIARELGKPWVSIKAISDTMTTQFPIDFNSIISQNGTICFTRLFLSILMNPLIVPGLYRLGVDSNYAAKSLAQFLREILY